MRGITEGRGRSHWEQRKNITQDPRLGVLIQTLQNLAQGGNLPEKSCHNYRNEHSPLKHSLGLASLYFSQIDKLTLQLFTNWQNFSQIDITIIQCSKEYVFMTHLISKKKKKLKTLSIIRITCMGNTIHTVHEFSTTCI